MRPLTTNPDNWDSRHPKAPWNEDGYDSYEHDRQTTCIVCDNLLPIGDTGICEDCRPMCDEEDLAQEEWMKQQHRA